MWFAFPTRKRDLLRLFAQLYWDGIKARLGLAKKEDRHV
jgi:hypothetical protein